MAMLLVALTMATTPSRAEAPAWGRIDALATGRAVAAPAGWLNHCMADLDRCRPGPGGSVAAADNATLALVAQVQREVNRRIAPRGEPEGRDLWLVGPPSGDCDDYALTKQALLRAAGLPAGAVRLATALLPNGELHAVVTVETTRGTLVLDNLQFEPVPLDMVGYRWLRLEQPGPGLRWMELQGPPQDAGSLLPASAGGRGGAAMDDAASKATGQ
jgi:predicted transglutaminase-like cysteine proteinase